MAIGMGRMMGFHYLENFNYPYIAKSVTDFWRRWHISLSTFFRDYVYIPLGGNRVSKPRWLFNIAVVWMLTGLWHGANWNFILWGVYFGVLLILEKLFWGKRIEKLGIVNKCAVEKYPKSQAAVPPVPPVRIFAGGSPCGLKLFTRMVL